MGYEGRPYRLDGIGSIRIEYYLRSKSLVIEAWSDSRMCRISFFSDGAGRRIELKLTDGLWWDMVRPVAHSGFWTWAKRYGSGPEYFPSWAISIMTTCGWYYSSGDGGYPEEFPQLIAALIQLSDRIESSGIKGPHLPDLLSSPDASKI